MTVNFVRNYFKISKFSILTSVIQNANIPLSRKRLITLKAIKRTDDHKWKRFNIAELSDPRSLIGYINESHWSAHLK